MDEKTKEEIEEVEEEWRRRLGEQLDSAEQLQQAGRTLHRIRMVFEQSLMSSQGGRSSSTGEWSAQSQTTRRGG